MVMGVGIRSLWRVVVSNRAGCRSIVMSAPRMEQALEKLEQNPYYEKYAARIAKLQRTQPEEFLQRVESAQRAEQEKRRAPRAPLTAPDTRQFSSVLNPKGDLKGDASAQDQKLEDIFKLELVKDKEVTEIISIWEEYHKNKEVISAAIPVDVYNGLQTNMQIYSTFVFPLPRSQGYEFIMSQCHAHSVHFTPLLAFQVHKENAPECLTMVHYTELQDKGVVLMRGEYDKNVLNAKEAQCLANLFQMYYSGNDADKCRLLQQFTEQPDSFKHMDLVAQLENISLV